jgi:hypothetical protein
MVIPAVSIDLNFPHVHLTIIDLAVGDQADARIHCFDAGVGQSKLDRG